MDELAEAISELMQLEPEPAAGDELNWHHRCFLVYSKMARLSSGKSHREYVRKKNWHLRQFHSIGHG